MVAKRAAEKVKNAKVTAKETEARPERFAMNFATLVNAQEVQIALLAIHQPILDGIPVVP